MKKKLKTFQNNVVDYSLLYVFNLINYYYFFLNCVRLYQNFGYFLLEGN